MIYYQAHFCAARNLRGKAKIFHVTQRYGRWWQAISELTFLSNHFELDSVRGGVMRFQKKKKEINYVTFGNYILMINRQNAAADDEKSMVYS